MHDHAKSHQHMHHVESLEGTLIHINMIAKRVEIICQMTPNMIIIAQRKFCSLKVT